MIDLRDEARLPLEPREALGVVSKTFRQHLYGDVAPETRVSGAIDLAHGAMAQQSDDFIGPEPVPRPQRHGPRHL
jgi:hypothetical protein